jgi:flavin reductase
MSSPLVFPRPAVDDRAFVEATSRLAGVVAIVTWRVEAPAGLLVRSVSLLSTRPPRVLFGVDKKDPAHAELLRAETCAVNVLSEADTDEAERFSKARPADAQFPPGRWRLQSDQPPRLIGGAIHLSGFVDHRIDAGSHSLFVVRVDTAQVTDRAPLVHFDHDLRQLAQPTATAGRVIQAGAAFA